MCLISGVSGNRGFSNLYRQAANLSHYMNRDKEFGKECANLLPAKYRSTLRAVADLDMIGVERVKNLKICFPAAADVGGDDGEFRTFSLAYRSRFARSVEAKCCWVIIDISPSWGIA